MQQHTPSDESPLSPRSGESETSPGDAAQHPEAEAAPRPSGATHLEQEEPLYREDAGSRKRHGDALLDGSGDRHGA